MLFLMKKKELSDRFKWCLPVICKHLFFGKSQRKISKALGISRNHLNKITKTKEFEQEMEDLKERFYEDVFKVFKRRFFAPKRAKMRQNPSKSLKIPHFTPFFKKKRRRDVFKNW